MSDDDLRQVRWAAVDAVAAAERESARRAQRDRLRLRVIAIVGLVGMVTILVLLALSQGPTVS